MMARSNEEWLTLLKPETRDVALAELGGLLQRGLRRGLIRYPWVDEAAIACFVEQALLEIPKVLDTFTGQSRFTTWAQKIAVHIALREIRKQRIQGGDMPPTMINTRNNSYVS